MRVSAHKTTKALAPIEWAAPGLYVFLFQFAYSLLQVRNIADQGREKRLLSRLPFLEHWL